MKKQGKSTRSNSATKSTRTRQIRRRSKLYSAGMPKKMKRIQVWPRLLEPGNRLRQGTSTKSARTWGSCNALRGEIGLKSTS